jgi:hypothetical protein
MPSKLLETFKKFFTNVQTNELTIVSGLDEFDRPSYYIARNGAIFAGPYTTEAAAKGQRTRYLKGYTPASRRPVETA